MVDISIYIRVLYVCFSLETSTPEEVACSAVISVGGRPECLYFSNSQLQSAPLITTISLSLLLSLCFQSTILTKMRSASTSLKHLRISKSKYMTPKWELQHPHSRMQITITCCAFLWDVTVRKSHTPNLHIIPVTVITAG